MLRFIQFSLALLGFKFLYTTQYYRLMDEFELYPILIILGGLSHLTLVLAGWSAYSILYYPQVVEKKLKMSRRAFVMLEAAIDLGSLVAYALASRHFSQMINDNTPQCFEKFGPADCIHAGNTAVFATFTNVPFVVSLLIGGHGLVTMKKNPSPSASGAVEKSVKIN